VWVDKAKETTSTGVLIKVDRMVGRVCQSKLYEVKDMGKAMVVSGSVDLVTVEERERFVELEGVIRDNVTGFIKVGLALKEIREQRLFRERYESFSAYCKSVWDSSKAYVNRNIAAAEVVQNLAPIGAEPLSDTLSITMNEAQIRPLTILKPAQQKKAWEKAVEISGGKPTALIVKKVVEEMVGGNIQKKRDLIRDDIKGASSKTTPNDFKEAFDRLIIILDSHRARKWKDFDRKLALQWLEQLRMELTQTNDKPE